MVYGSYGTMTVLSPSWASSSDAYSFNAGFQGMRRDAVTGLYYTPNRDYIPGTGIWLQADPAGYVNGSSLCRFADSDPEALLDPLGTMTIAERITGIMVARLMRLGITPLVLVNWADGVLGWDLIRMHDQENEMTPHLSDKMDAFYLWMASNEFKDRLTSEWQTFQITRRSAKAAVGQFEFQEDTAFDPGWWLHGAHDVFASGTIELKCKHGSVDIRNHNIDWEWDDGIAANKWREQTQKWTWKTGIGKAVEGWYAITADTIAHAYFPIEIFWKDNRSFPNGLFIGRQTPPVPPPELHDWREDLLQGLPGNL